MTLPRRDVIELVPKELIFSKGVGKHKEKLTSFELALRSAGIAACNLVRVSSIFPPVARSCLGRLASQSSSPVR